MINAAEALKAATAERKRIADKFMAEHPDVMGKIEKLIKDNKDKVQVYYDNMGELSVDSYTLGLALMELGYGVRAANPAVERSGISIRWAPADKWYTDDSDFTWKGAVSTAAKARRG